MAPNGEFVGNATLLVVEGADTGIRLELASEQVTLGRGVHNTLRLNDSEISRQHCRLKRVDGGFSLVDSNSSNGTFVNGKPVRNCVLVSGDHIQIGRTVLLFSDAAAVSGAAARERVLISARNEPDPAANIVGEASADTGDGSILLPAAASGSLELNRAIANLQTLYKIAEDSVRPSLSLEALLNRVLDQVVDVTGADRGCILVRSDDPVVPIGGDMQPVAFRDRRGSGTKMSVSRTIVDYVIRSRQGVRTTNASGDERFAAGQSIVQEGIREAMCVPLQVRNDLLGVIYVDIFTPPEQVLAANDSNSRFREDQLRLLVAIGRHSALLVEDHRYQQALLKAERLAAVGHTIAILSHHIKNILQGVRGGSYLIDMGLKQHDETLVRKGWSVVDRNQDRIYHLVMDMLTFSKERTPSLQTGQLNDVVTEVVELLSPRAEELRLQLTVETDPTIPPTVFDPEAIHRAVLNIVGNALDATEGDPAGRVSVVTKIDPETNLLSVSVTDNGSGIPEDRLAQIFNIFESTKGARGTGIGLAVSQKIMHEHGGEILVESTPGKGSCFKLVWPAVDEDPLANTMEKTRI